MIKEEISTKLPLLIIKNFRADKKLEDGYWYEDEKLYDLIKIYVSDFNPRTNYFGVETRDDCNLLISQLEAVYNDNYSESIPSSNDTVALEAIRLRLLPPEIIKEEFDKPLRKKIDFREIPQGAFKEEILRIDSMTQQEREEMVKSFKYILEEITTRNAYNVSGFAIDPITMEYSISSGFGNHGLARLNIDHIIEMIENLNRSKDKQEFNKDELRDRKNMIIGGFIFTNFKVPILMIMSEADNQNVLKIGRFFIDQRKFVPIDWDGKVIK